jgi:hypothetical protein
LSASLNATYEISEVTNQEQTDVSAKATFEHLQLLEPRQRGLARWIVGDGGSFLVLLERISAMNEYVSRGNEIGEIRGMRSCRVRQGENIPASLVKWMNCFNDMVKLELKSQMPRSSSWFGIILRVLLLWARIYWCRTFVYQFIASSSMLYMSIGETSLRYGFVIIHAS